MVPMNQAIAIPIPRQIARLKSRMLPFSAWYRSLHAPTRVGCCSASFGWIVIPLLLRFLEQSYEEFLAFHGINTPGAKAKSVTHVCGTKSVTHVCGTNCHLCLRSTIIDAGKMVAEEGLEPPTRGL